MKKSKGFTLIELLGVILILAVIMVIAVPKIIDVIEKAEMQAFKESVELMAHTAVVQYETKVVKGEIKEIPEEGISYIYEANEQINIEEVGLLNYKGDKPLSGTITLTKGKKTKIIEVVSKNGKWCAVKAENEKGATVGRATELGCTLEEVVEDKKPCEMEKETIEGVKVHYIDSASDLYAFSQSVNSGTSYEGEKIIVRNNLDMSKAQGTCVTTFDPIGTSTTPFKGTFEGGAKKISNLTINKPNQDNVGLFGYAEIATIYGVILDNINIIGNNKVGGIVGYSNNSKVREILIDNITINGASTVGGAFGSLLRTNSSSYYCGNIVIKNGTLIASGSNVGYTAGDAYAHNSIVENLKITASSVTYRAYEQYNNYISRLSTYNGNYDNDYFNANVVDDINAYEAAGLDTYIGGDAEKGDALAGYYFDYDNSGEITLKKVKDNTFKLTMKKDKNNYYQITSEAEWKQASAHLSEKYILTQDLNFNSKKYYMMGGITNFTGELKGNDKNISNVSIYANKMTSIGIFPNTKDATIYGLNLKNVIITGKDNVGTLIGNSTTSNIYGITLDNINITGNNKVGGIVGYSNNSRVKEVALDNITINAASTVGGAFGSLLRSNVNTYYCGNIVIKNGTLISSGSNVGYTAGDAYAHNSIVENLKITASTVAYRSYEQYNNYISRSSTYNGNYDNDFFSSSNIDNLSYYSGKIETVYQGDANNTGYFFDYDDEHGGKVWLVKAYTSTPSTSITPSTSSTMTYTNPSCSEQTAPTCELKSMQILTNGFTPLVECTDDTQIESFRSYFDSRTSKAAEAYEDIGNDKSNISWSNSNKTIIYNGTWRTTNKTGPWPKSGVCYYFRYGAKDTCGNYSTYVSDSCFSF